MFFFSFLIVDSVFHGQKSSVAEKIIREDPTSDTDVDEEISSNIESEKAGLLDITVTQAILQSSC